MIGDVVLVGPQKLFMVIKGPPFLEVGPEQQAEIWNAPAPTAGVSDANKCISKIPPQQKI